ncbi:MAG: flagellar hook-length control protein FliK [Treponema sp.]|nr:flagellar hook-length control protein FliK [Treponema sp.]
MIALSAQKEFTEPVTAKSALDNIVKQIGLEKSQNDYKEPVKAYENEEEHSNFAEVLAEVVNDSKASEAQSKPLKSEKDSLSLKQLNLENDLETDLSFFMHNIASEQEGIKLSEDEKDVFINDLIGGQSGFVDQLFSQITEITGEEINNDLLSKISLEEKPKSEMSFLDKLKSKKDVSALGNNKDTQGSLETQLSAQTALVSSAAKQTTEEVQGESSNKKRKSSESKVESFLKSDNTQTAEQVLSSLKKAGNENALSNNRQSNEEKPGRLDEMRNRRRDRITFEVRDQRTADGSQIRTFYSAETASRLSGEASLKEITLELRLPEFNNSLQSAQTSWEARAANGSALETMLSRELHQTFNGDIVRHASMALKDGGESTIRLALRPESLGNVKIQLEMSENKITGVILVESEEALNAFRKEITALEQAFKEAGFADANLDLSLSSGESNSGRGYEAETVTPQMAASSYEDSLRDTQLDRDVLISAYGHGAGSLNILA